MPGQPFLQGPTYFPILVRAFGLTDPGPGLSILAPNSECSSQGGLPGPKPDTLEDEGHHLDMTLIFKGFAGCSGRDFQVAAKYVEGTNEPINNPKTVCAWGAGVAFVLRIPELQPGRPTIFWPG